MTKLTEEMIMSRHPKHKSIDDIFHLHLWGMSLSDVTFVRNLPNVRSISLSMNCVTTLQPFSHCKNLCELYLRSNDVRSLSELHFLSDLENLRILWLSGNPIAADANYRAFAISVLPRLTKLDEVDLSEEERAGALRLFREKRMDTAYPEPAARTDFQERILSAVRILIGELNASSLEKLSLQVQQLLHDKCA